MTEHIGKQNRVFMSENRSVTVESHFYGEPATLVTSMSMNSSERNLVSGNHA